MSGRGRQSPYEQGELKPSPEYHKKKKSKKSKRSHQMAPEAKVHVQTGDEDDDDVQIIEAGDHGEEEGGSLTIKPPPASLGKHKEKGHKRKKDKHKSKDLSKDHGRLFEKFEPPRDAKTKESTLLRDARDAREIVKERKKERELKEKEIAREMKEREARKREESIKERERLERMELERRRERQAREEAIQVRQQNRPFPDSRRRGKERRDQRPAIEHRSRSRDEPRSRDRGHKRSFPPPPGLQEEKGIKREPGHQRPASPIKSPAVKSEKISPSQDTRVVVVDKEDKSKPSEVQKDSGKEKDSRSSFTDVKNQPVEDEEEEEDEEADDESSNSDSGSEDSDSDSSSDEEDESSDEEEEGEDEGKAIVKEEMKEHVTSEEEADEANGMAKLRSKFDDHSDAESARGGNTDRSGSDNDMPEFPDLSDVEMRPEDALPPYLPAIQGCRSVEEFNCLNRIEEGTYGVVYRALDKKTDEIVALKRLKMEKEKEGFPITSLREINTLLKAQHENIVTVREIVVGSNMDKIYIVMDFVEHDLKSLMEGMKNPFLVGEVKTLLKQLLSAVRHLHDNWILHRDLKTSNLLLSHQGILKVGDFGLAREYGSPLRHYTPVVVTLWYRAPELLLGIKEYSTPIDMWSVGCIFAEFLLMKAFWPGKSEIDQINRIFKDLGTPTETIWPGMMDLPGCKKVTFNQHQYNVVRNRFGSYFTDLGFDLLNKLFTYDPSKRITADGALGHEYFKESPNPIDPSMFPTWPARSEEGRKHASSPKPPSGGKAYQKLMDDEENLTAGGFHMPSAAKGASAQGMGFALKF